MIDQVTSVAQLLLLNSTTGSVTVVVTQMRLTTDKQFHFQTDWWDWVTLTAVAQLVLLNITGSDTQVSSETDEHSFRQTDETESRQWPTDAFKQFWFWLWSDGDEIQLERDWWDWVTEVAHCFKFKQYQFWKHRSQVRLMSTVAERPMRWGHISGIGVLRSTHSENRKAQLQTNWWGCRPESQQWHSGFTFKQYPFWKQKSTAADKLMRLLEPGQWHSQCLLSYSIDSNTQVTVRVENSCKIVLAPGVTAQWLEWVTSTQWHQ